MKLTDIATAGLPNIRAELGLETPLQTQMRQMQQGQILGQQFTGLPPAIASLAQGVAGNIPSVVDNVRKGAMSLGVTGLETEGELFDKALANYDGTPQSRARVVQELTKVNPNFGAMMAEKMRATDIAEAQALSTTMFNTARADQLNREAGELSAMRNVLKPLLVNTQFANISEDDFAKLGEDGLKNIWNEVTEKKDFSLFQGQNNQGVQQSVFFNNKNGKFYDSQDTSRELSPSEVPEMIYRASVQAGSAEDLVGGNAAQRALIESGVATSGLFETITKAIDIVEQDPAALSNPSKLAAFATSLAYDIDAAKKLIAKGMIQSNEGFDPNSAEIQDALKTYGFVGAGEAAAELNSLIIGLAYGAAAAQEGGNTISNSDVANRMKQIGANQSNPATFITNLTNFAQNAWVQYETRYKMTKPNELPTDNFGYDYILLSPEKRAALRALTPQ